MTTPPFPSFFPPFSWDTVPAYEMFADKVRFKDDDVSAIAENTDFLCIEKQHGIKDLGAADIGARHAIGQFKAIKPGMTCLVYLNSAYAYPFISRSKVFDWRGEIHKPENAKYKSFLLVDPATGDLAYREGDHVHYFDVLNPEFREWWAETVGIFVREAGGDGLFVDQMHGFEWLRADRSDEVRAAQALMMRMAKEAICADKVLLLNNAAHLPGLFEIGDAFMFEHYRPELLSKEHIVEDWALMKRVAEAKKISVWRIGVEQDDVTVSMRERGEEMTPGFLEELSRKRMPYYLAAFLVGAREYSYFQYGWGWNLYTGPLCRYSEWKKPLGNPLGEATRDEPDGWVFRREFEQASVVVDLERREGEIDWKG
jgi:hypothetical protein